MRIVFCGDFFPRLHMPAGQGETCKVDEEVWRLIQGADLLVVNLETAIGQALEPANAKRANFLLGPDEFSFFPFPGTTVACLANNHIMDFGRGGLRSTLEALEKRGFHPVGAALQEPQPHGTVVLDVNRERVAVVNQGFVELSSPRRFGGAGANEFDEVRLREDLARARAQHAFVIFVFHGGIEFLPAPIPGVRAVFRKSAEWGADLAVGHHPHVVQGLEWFGETPAFYSLGNLAPGVAHGPPGSWGGDGAILEVVVERGALEHFEWHPLDLQEQFRCTLAMDETRDSQRREFFRRSAVLEDEAVYSAIIDSAARRLLHAQYLPLMGRSAGSLTRAEQEKIWNLFANPAHREMIQRALAEPVPGSRGINGGAGDLDLAAGFLARLTPRPSVRWLSRAAGWLARRLGRL